MGQELAGRSAPLVYLPLQRAAGADEVAAAVVRALPTQTPTPVATPAPAGLRLSAGARPGWERRLARAVVGVDFVAASVAATAAAGTGAGRWGIALAASWLGALHLSGAHECRAIDAAGDGRRAVLRATAILGVPLAAVQAGALPWSPALPALLLLVSGLLVALAVAAVLTLGLRAVVRARLSALRRGGRCRHRVVAVGSPSAVADLVQALRRATSAGLDVVGACLERRGPDAVTPVGVPVLGTVDDLPGALGRAGATTVIATAGGLLARDPMRRLSWDLKSQGVELLVAPLLVDCVVPRVSIRVAGAMPLLRVGTSSAQGAWRLVKGVMDRGLAALGLVGLLPLLGVVAVLVRLSSPGPALFRQTRMGRGGREFVLYKFRTMYVDAEQRLGELWAHNEHRGGPLFKMRNDPRITRIGAVLRKYSLDELPQLLNVLRGEMSLVGPRPPLPQEVVQYSDDAKRRLLVQPGLTGLWQVSGRSDLDWEETVRLDLHYVENWSLGLDLQILLRTVSVVARGAGAY